MSQSQEVRVLSKEEQLNVLVQIHQFLSNYDRVPGAFASQFAQVLEGLALVANSIQSEVKTTETTVCPDFSGLKA
jgi:hypothetical protein